ncbi:MAG: insulinase family protein [Pseudomonadota bacterium]
MSTKHGFQLLKEEEIKELKVLARVFRHVKTGAELLSLTTDDENKVFGITFRTPPSDSTGVAHILEHSVLCGSRKYPVKEPFVELLKGSLQTFLNAFTYPDKTCYPVASQNLQDFYNLVDVYLDAVLYPRISRSIFQQEGWHFELENASDPFSYKGVVFNEMKGAYSSPDTLLSEYSLQSLFPDNAYGFDAGGDPRQIPNLTYEQFHSFHKRYYHPSNARIYFYGDDDPDERLKRVNAYLRDFDPVEIDSEIRLQIPSSESRRLIRPFMAGDENGEAPKGMVTLNWMLTQTTDVETNFALHILDYILLGMPGSPLRKALIDSGLGEDIAGGGLGSELRQIYFSTGLKGIETGNADKLETLVLETLKKLARSGIDAETKEAALNTIEFRLRENNTGSFPRGLSLMLRSLTTWLYDSNPLALLAFEEPLETIKSRVRATPAFFEEMIDRMFLSNPHRTTLILEPDTGLREREEADENDRLTKARSAMIQSEMEEVIDNTRELKRLQGTPDPLEALAAIPVLKLEDLDKKNRPIPLAFPEGTGIKTLFHDLFTNGIVYLDLGLNLRYLPPEYLSYVPLFGRALVEMGTEMEDFVSLTQRISRKTGGIKPHSFVSDVKDSKKSAAYLFLRGKAMVGQAGDLIDILHDVLLKVRLDNRDRFKQMVLEEKSRVEQKMIPAGHQMVKLRLSAHFSEAHWAAEQMSGVSYLFFVKKLAKGVDEDWPGVLAVLRQMHQILLNRRTMVSNVTIDPSGWPRIESHLGGLVGTMPEGPLSEMNWPSGSDPIFEGMTIPSQVNYVGKGADLYHLGYRFHGSARVIIRYLRNTWLWDQVRVQGGAYGAFCLLDRFSGVLAFVSYRDPNLLETIETFDRSDRFLDELTLSHQELTKSIIGAIGDLDSHMLPDAKGFASLVRHLTGDTEADRQQMRDEILGTTAADFKTMARLMREVGKKGIVKVLGSPTAIKAAARERPGWLKVIKVL